MSLPRSHHHPAHLSPQVSSITQAGGASCLSASWVPMSYLPSLHSIAPVALPIVLAGATSLPQPHAGVVHLTPVPSHTGHKANWTCALVPLLLLGSQSTCRLPGLALHISHCAFHQPSPVVSWVTTRIQTRRASHALGGLSAHLSPMCLLGRQQMCLLQRLLPQPLWSPILQHLGTDTFHPSSQWLYGGTRASGPSPPALWF